MADYRYTLERDVAPLTGEGTLLWVMLNPSTADDTEDDPTIRRCIRFTRDLGYSRLEVVNLYAMRATKPMDLVLARYPVGSANDNTISHRVRAVAEPGAIMCAWGGNAKPDRAAAVRRLIEESRRPEVPVLALRINGDGTPGHPLYLRADTEPVPYTRGIAEVTP